MIQLTVGDAEASMQIAPFLLYLGLPNTPPPPPITEFSEYVASLCQDGGMALEYRWWLGHLGDVEQSDKENKLNPFTTMMPLENDQ